MLSACNAIVKRADRFLIFTVRRSPRIPGSRFIDLFPTDCLPASHPMDGAVLGPPSEELATVVEEEAERTPERRESHVSHDGWNISGFDDCHASANFHT